MDNKDAAFYMDELNGDECYCGRLKQPRHSFCPKCYAKIPPDMRIGLYKGIGLGYEDSYEEVVKYLSELS